MSVRAAAVWAMASQYVTFVIQFAVSVIISRFFLTPAEFGLFSIAMATALMVSILQDFGLTRYISGAAKLDDEHRRLCSTIAFLFSLLIAAILLAIAYPVATLYREPELVTILVIIAASYLAVPLSVVPCAVLARDMNFQGLFYVNCGGAIVNAICALGLAWLGYSVYALAWAMVATAAARAIFAQMMAPSPLRLHFRWSEARPIVMFGSATSALFVCGAIGSRTPDLIIGYLLPLAAVGLFSRATSLAAQFQTLVAGAIGGVFYPAFARLRDKGEALGAPYVRVVSGYTAIIWPSMAGLAVAAEPLVRLLYGEKWVAVAPLLWWVAISQMIFVALPLHVELPILLGKIGKLIRLNVLDTAASIILLFIGTAISLEMAAASRIGYGLIWLFIYARFIHHLVQFDWRALLRVYCLSLIGTVAAITPLLLAYLFWVPASQMNLIELALFSGFGVLCWLGTLFAIRHPGADEIKGIAMVVIAPLISRFNHLRAVR
jgi:O-antigen/teichoic acid export membrane protein